MTFVTVLVNPPASQAETMLASLHDVWMDGWMDGQEDVDGLLWGMLVL